MKFTYKGRFLTINIAYENVEILKSRFLAEFQSFIFGQFWAFLGRFCCIDSG
jgi:hypothetical protein